MHLILREMFQLNMPVPSKMHDVVERIMVKNIYPQLMLFFYIVELMKLTVSPCFSAVSSGSS